MSHISATNTSGRVLQPDIPPPSFDAENCLPPLNLASQGTVGQEATASKGFWFFKRNNRGGPTSSKLSAPSMARSLSEPNSPTEPSGAVTPSRQKAEEKPNYISLAIQLLNESKVRFDGHEKDWARFHDRYHQLFAMGQPINGKIVKYNTPKPNAQDVAKLLVRDIQAKLEELDAEMEALDPEDNSSASKSNDIRRAFASTPEPTIAPPLKPWFNPSTINPVVLDKVAKHRSINPEGTWHGHSRSRSTAPSRPLPNFSMHDTRNKDESRRAGSETAALISTHDHRDPVREDRGQVYNEAGERERKKDKEIERERDRRREGEKEKEKGDTYGRERERDSDKDKPRDKDGERELGDGGPSKAERGRKDRQRHHRDNISRSEYPPRPGSIPRERQMSDPAIYTRSSHRRNPSPESLAPAIYTLAEDIEVREGTSSVASRDPVPVAIPRIPTVVAYPGDEEEELNNIYGAGGRSGPNGGNRPRRGPATPLTPILASDAGGSSGVVANGSDTSHPHRRRRRSRSLGHELDGRVNKSRPRSRSPKKDRTMEKEWEKEREREREKERQRDRNRNREEREREREKEKGGGRDRAREERDREKDRDGERERNKDKNRQRDRDGEKEWDRGKGKEKDMRPVHQEERERYDPRGRRTRERERDKDRDRDHERERDKGWAREKDKNKDREREQDPNQDRNKDREYESNYRSELEQLASAPPPTQSANVVGAHGPAWPTPSTPPSLYPTFNSGVPATRLFLPNPNSESRFVEILTSPTPPMPYDLPGPK